MADKGVFGCRAILGAALHPRGVCVGQPEERGVGEIVVHKLAPLHHIVGVEVIGDVHVWDDVDGDETRRGELRAGLGHLGRPRPLEPLGNAGGEVARERLATYYAKAGLFVLPSYHEGFGMALTEAMSHGLAIISTHVGAIPETVPAAAGELIAPGDAPALAVSLRRFITDTATRTHAGTAARQAADRLPGWAETGAAFLAAVDNLSLN